MRISDWNSDVCPSDLAGRTVRRPDLTLAVADHNLPTTPRVDARGARLPIADPGSAEQLAALEANVAQFGVPYIEATAEAQGLRSDELRVGKEGVRTFRSRWSQYL